MLVRSGLIFIVAWFVPHAVSASMCRPVLQVDFPIIELGDVASFTCRACNTNPAPTFIDVRHNRNQSCLYNIQYNYTECPDLSWDGNYTTDEEFLFMFSIKQFTAERQGSYECEFQTGFASFPIDVLLKVPVTSVYLTPVFQNASVLEHQTEQFHCNASGRPAPIIEWYIEDVSEFVNYDTNITHNSSTISSSCNIDNDNVTCLKSTLALLVGPHDQGKRIYCNASNGINAVTSDVKPVLNVLRKPTKPIIVVSGNAVVNFNISVVKGQSLDMNGTSSGNPTPTIYWLSQLKYEILANPLRIDNIQINDEGEYNCTARNDLNTSFGDHIDGVSTTVIELIVQFPPEPPRCHVGDTNISSGTVRAIKDRPLVINCSSSSKPAPIYYWWVLPNGTNATGNSLTIHSVQNNLNNMYLVNVMNQMEPTLHAPVPGFNSTSIQLDILYPPSTPQLFYGGANGSNITTNSIVVINGTNVSVSCLATSNPPAVLTWSNNSPDSILNVTIEDNQTRTCSATTYLEPTGTKAENVTTNVSVSFETIFPPHKPELKITSCENGPHIMNNDIIHVINGVTVRISCISIGKPTPEYIWTPTGGTNEGILTLSYFEMGIQYKCMATNTLRPTFENAITANSSSGFFVDILEHPTIRCNATYTVVMNEDLNVTCDTVHGNPKQTNYTWAKHKSSRILSRNEFLYIPHIQLNQEGIYIVTVTNYMEPTGCEAKIGSDSIGINVDVQFEANITAFLMPGRNETTVVIDQHTTLTIYCDVMSDPSATIQILFQNRTANKTLAGQRLEYRKDKAACEQDMGVYSCFSNNTHNTDPKRKDLIVRIRCSPRISPGQTTIRNITRSLNESASFSLNVFAYPPPEFVDYRWEKRMQNNQWMPLSNTSKTVINVAQELQQTNLTIDHIVEEDFGVYRVNVSNNFSRNIADILSETFYLVASSKPDKPFNIHVLNESITTHSMSVAWEPGFDGGHEQHFIVMYKEQIEPDWNRIEVNASSVYVSNITNLRAALMYTIKMVAVNIIGESEETEPIGVSTLVAFSNEVKQNPSVVGAAVGGTLAACLIVVGAVVVYKLRRRIGMLKDRTTSNTQARYCNRPNSSSRKTHEYVNHTFASNMQTKPDNEQTDTETVKFLVTSEFKTNVDNKNHIEATYRNLSGDTLNDESIPISQLRSKVKRYQTDSKEAFNEYQALHRGLKNATEAANKVMNVPKNRYKNMYPYDFNRVKLASMGTEDDDFINASFINGYERPRRYIAAQGPLLGTIEDFWRMVVAENVSVIVMLTKLMEEAKAKCCQYWHDDVGFYGQFSITTVKCTQYGNFVVRHLSCVKHGSTTRHDVTQYHFTAWPDKDVPDTALSLTQFWEHVRRNETTKDQPWIVHCSAGVGRTGTFIALDFLYDRGKAEGVVSVFDAVQNLREQRISMVQTKEQYLYLYATLCEALHPIGKVYTTDEFHATMSSPQRTHLLQQQFQEICDETMPVVDEYEFRPKLHSLIAGRSDSIDAVFISTYLKKNALILAQYPRSDTMIDFIRLVIDYGVKTVLTMEEDIQQEQKLCGRDGTQLKFGPFTVTTISKQKSTNFSQTKLRCDCTNTVYVQDVTVYEFTAWSSKSQLSDEDAFIDLLNELNNTCTEGPVILQCRDGHSRSGLLAVLLSVIERIKIDKEVAIAQEVRMMRCRKPQVIVDATQYIFCHDVALKYLENCIVYENV
ncbi:uncharacterized protein LOC127869263 isoform X2 [Dreissena polymorpha]|nr:uncharacterized protein LOC127869263 isoform X2 [Dreissena polymorpha]